MIRVVVASTNPNKIEGVRRAFREFYKDVSVVGRNVSSNVPDVPFDYEVFEGARNRVLNLLRKCEGFDFYVSIESGIFRLLEKHFMVSVCALISSDNKNRIYYGIGPSFHLNKKIVSEIKRSGDMKKVLEQIFKVRNLSKEGGYISIISRGVVKREDINYYAVLMAISDALQEDLLKDV